MVVFDVPLSCRTVSLCELPLPYILAFIIGLSTERRDKSIQCREETTTWLQKPQKMETVLFFVYGYIYALFPVCAFDD